MALVGEMQYLTIGDNTYSLPSSGGSGTVTSIGVSNATDGGLTISGSPVTSSGSITIGHSNVLTSAQTTSGVYPIKIDKNGHISEYGSAVTIPSITLNGSSTTSPSFYAPTTAGTDGYYLKSNGSGEPTWASVPAGVTVTLNGNTTTTPSFYAPTSAGTDGYVLKSNGSGAPTWTSATLTDTLVTQTNATPSSYTYWRPLIIGSSSNTTEGFTPSTTTAGTYTFNTLEVQPSSGTIRMGKVSMYNGSYTTKISPTTLTANRTITIPNATGTLALTSDITDEKLLTTLQSDYSLYNFIISGSNTSTAESKYLANGIYYQHTVDNYAILTLGDASNIGNISFKNQNANYCLNLLPSTLTANRTITFPDKTGTVALTSDVTQVKIVRWSEV